MIIHMDLEERGYDIAVERGILSRIREYADTDRKVLIVTDSGVPAIYPRTVAAQCTHPVTAVIPQGEGSKSLEGYSMLIRRLLDENFTRSDCVIAVGGGVTGDLAGFAAATYMRGIDFYNIPSTLLSQIDSSIGGKVAINFEGVKNIAGAFYQPSEVLIDPDLLLTLPDRQISNGLAEAVKMSLTSDAGLFSFIERCDITEGIDRIIVDSLNIKKSIVEQDEKEKGLRKILNFGHTLGHGIESERGGRLYHGECVALGMIPVCSEKVRARLIPVLKKAGLPCSIKPDREKVMNAVIHDKKFSGDRLSIVKVDNIGTAFTEKITADRLPAMLDILEEKR